MLIKMFIFFTFTENNGNNQSDGQRCAEKSKGRQSNIECCMATHTPVMGFETW